MNERASGEGTAVAIHRIAFDLDEPPGHVAAYLVLGGDAPVLVDAGVPGDDAAEELRRALGDHDLAAADVEHLLLTHPHVDHVGQVPTVLDAGGATVYALRGVRERLERSPTAAADRVRSVAATTGLDEAGISDLAERAAEKQRRDRKLLPPDEIDALVDHGERFDPAGLPVEAIHTPGHQAEHACFVLEPGGDGRDAAPALFSGDVLIEPFRAGAINAGFDDGAYEGVAAFRAAYDRLEGRPVGRVYPGHGPVFADAAGALRRSRADLDALTEAVFSALAERAPASPVEVNRARTGESGGTLSLMETMGALGYLAEAGRATVDIDVNGIRRFRPADD